MTLSIDSCRLPMRQNAGGILNLLSSEQESKSPYRTHSGRRCGGDRLVGTGKRGKTMHSKKTSLIFLLVCVLMIISAVFILRGFSIVILSVRLMFILGEINQHQDAVVFINLSHVGFSRVLTTRRRLAGRREPPSGLFCSSGMS